MLKELKKKIKNFIKKSCESYYFTTKKDIEQIAEKICSYDTSYINNLTQNQLEYIFRTELTSDIELFQDSSVEPIYVDLLIDIVEKFNISKEWITEDIDFIMCHSKTYEEYMEDMILEFELLGEIDVHKIYKYLDIDKIWKDKYESTHYICQSSECIFEFPWDIK